MKNSLIALGALLLGVASVQATPLLVDTFPTNGNLVGTTPSVGGIWTALNAQTPALAVSSGSLVIPNANAQDAASQYTSAQTGSIFAGFDFTLTTIPTNSNTGSYIVAFRDGPASGSGEYVGRLFVRHTTGTSATEYQIGISTHTDFLTDPGAVIWSANLTLNTAYHFVMRFDTTTDNTTLWVDPTTIASTNITSSDTYAVTDLDGFAFRSASATHGTSGIDNLRVGTTFADAMPPVPEPSTIALCGLVMVAAAALRLKKRYTF